MPRGSFLIQDSFLGEPGQSSTTVGMIDSLLSHIGRAGIEIYNACVMLGNLYAESEVQRHNVYYGDSYGRVEYQPIAALPADMADNYLERQASRAWDMDCYYMGRCGGDAVLMTAEIGMLAKGAVDATLAVYDGLKAAVGIGSAGGGFRLVSIAGGGQTVLAPAGVAEGTVEEILGGVAEGSLSGFGFHTINDFLDNLAKIDADRVFGGEGKAINNAIPNVEGATINRKKLTEYALNPNHPVGGNKAKVFESALGYNQSNADDLMRQIYEKLPSSEAILGKLDEYGQRYIVDILITGPNGKTMYVRTGWIIKTGSNIPELTTIFVKD